MFQLGSYSYQRLRFLISYRPALRIQLHIVLGLEHNPYNATKIKSILNPSFESFAPMHKFECERRMFLLNSTRQG